GHGPLANRAALIAWRGMIATAVERVSALKEAGRTLEQAKAAKPLAGLSNNPGGFVGEDAFVESIWGRLKGVYALVLRIVGLLTCIITLNLFQAAFLILCAVVGRRGGSHPQCCEQATRWMLKHVQKDANRSADDQKGWRAN